MQDYFPLTMQMEARRERGLNLLPAKLHPQALLLSRVIMSSQSWTLLHAMTQRLFLPPFRQAQDFPPSFHLSGKSEDFILQLCKRELFPKKFRHHKHWLSVQGLCGLCLGNNLHQCSLGHTGAAGKQAQQRSRIRR